ncbi:MAG TPA: nicotinate-nucleotide adenylyltransferase [Ktedonobacteraceae bacterium]|nr:nicotinate-nucleotide adenylyltransferase [Ktedonobacteraceae bacterium]
MANQGDSQGPRAGEPDAGTPGVEETSAREQGVEGIGAAEVNARKKRIGVLGGTFDPIHYAHLALAEDVYHELKLARIIFVPAGQPPHKMGYSITPVEQRVAMLEQAIAANPHFALSLVDVRRAGPSYTVDTLRLLHEEQGADSELYFIIGGDSLRDLPGWYDPAGVIARAMIVAVMRPGYAEPERSRSALLARLPGLEQRLITVEGPRMDLSSTDLRQRVATGRPITYQTPEVVETYILQHGLYRPQTDEDRRGWKQRDAHATNAI